MQRLKEKATRRRGRGFNSSANEVMDTADDRNAEFDAVEGDHEEHGPKRSIEGWILFVTGIQEESTEDDIATPFGDFGAIKNIHLNIDRRTGYLKVKKKTKSTFLATSEFHMFFLVFRDTL